MYVDTCYLELCSFVVALICVLPVLYTLFEEKVGSTLIYNAHHSVILKQCSRYNQIIKWSYFTHAEVQLRFLFSAGDLICPKITRPMH